MNLIINSVLAEVVPSTVTWTYKVALVMIASNLVAVFIGRFAIKKSGSGPDLPFPKPALWKNFGLPELLATASLGHVLGAGFILGLGNAGLL
ncbi:MAG: photosystem I reaction center subunit PsaK [Cyanobacterium sp. T60_A2020_053]|nr:photosystem I reaction center subunit PsaK [Cyanobacterium sp. T60_A2020_053]